MSCASLRSSAFVAALAFGLTAGAAGHAGASVTAEGPFIGTLPCADCEGIRTELTLLRDARNGAPTHFLLRETYLGKPSGAVVFESMGPWQDVGPGMPVPEAGRVRIDPFQPQWRHSFLRLGPAVLELLDRDERRIRSRANLRLELTASAAPAAPASERVLLAGTLQSAGPMGLQLRPCAGSGTQRAIDVSPESMVTAVLAELGLDRRGEIYVEAFGRVVDGAAMFERLNRAGVEMRCPEAGHSARWQAQGNEPFWALRAEGDRTTFSQPGEPPVAHPSIDPTWRWRGGRRDRAGAHLFSQTEAGVIEAVLLPGICRDTMAEAAYGYRAEVILGSATARRTFSGCAYLGAGTAPP